MKSDVMITQTADDQTFTASSKFISRPAASKTRPRRWGTNCRLAEQIEAERVCLSSELPIEARLKHQRGWQDRDGQPEGHAYYNNQNFTMDKSRQFGNNTDRGVMDGDEESDWANASDDDGTSGVASGINDFHTTVLKLEKGTTDSITTEIPHFLGRSEASRTPPSPTNEPENSPEKILDASLSSSPMETEISSFFPASKNALERSAKDLSSKKQGMSPRQRLLYRYQMEEMMMSENAPDEENSRETPNVSVISEYHEPSTDAGLDNESSSDFAEPPDSPCSWKTSRSAGTELVEEPPNHSTNGLLRDCHICGYSPRSREDNDEHMKTTHFTHKCHLCIYWSRSPGRLNRHMKNFHSEPNATPANKKPKNPRKYTCKQCDFFTYVQEEIWNHTRMHVPSSKLLSCPHCPFVCAFKHHMQYHVNNHMGYKPFKCSECNYRCNNKSMLNSHKKSHSNDYPYRCGVCNYAAKYRHALNIHLRKKKHFAVGEVLLEERQRIGRTRNRGGAAVHRNQTPVEHLPSSVLLFPEEVGGDMAWPESQLSMMMGYDSMKQEPETMSHSVNVSYLQSKHQPVAYGLSGASLPSSLIPLSELSHMQHLHYSSVALPAKATPVVQGHTVPQLGSRVLPQASSIPASLATRGHSPVYEINHQFCLLPDGRQIQARSNYQTAYINQNQEGNVLCSPRRYSVDTVQDYASDSGDDWPLDLTAKSNNRKAKEHNHKKSWDTSTETPQLDWYECQHCGIIFPDRILYSMHMEYHSQSDPFLCNLCGQLTKDRREFFNHISQVAHN